MPGVNVQHAGAVIDLFHEAAHTNQTAPCRQGSIDVIRPPGLLIATGDLHDNPVHLARVEHLASLGAAEPGTEPSAPGPAGAPPLPHATFHEVIHSDRLLNGLDLSYRALARIAELKLAAPERVHTLLANHELAQIVGAGIVKDGVKCVEAFNDGLGYVFGDDWERVSDAIGVFIRSMPLALRCVTPRGDVLCAHSLPGLGSMGRFDATILSRDLTEADYTPRVGSAHLMVWGRGYDAEQLEDLVERWGGNLFILGHEKAEQGWALVPPCAVVLNSDHERGAYLPVDLEHPPSMAEIPSRVGWLGGSLPGG
ncbi:MAG: hypothetical protein IPJ41_02265 [Phycisphaerales bacterium]|nr:hypothetical protein [Phycisphaerales bacterium]